jgi:hypothetical protein
MKMNKYTTIITVFFLFLISFSASAQFEYYFPQKPFDPIPIKKLKPTDEYIGIIRIHDGFNFKFNRGVEEDFNFWGDTGFGGSNFAVLNAGFMVEARKRAALEDWYNKQRGLIKDEIEEYYNKDFNSFNEAVDKAFIDYGKSNYNYFDWNVSSLKSNHINTNRQYKARNKVNVRELHHLDYRKQEILSGNINNSIFTFSEIYGGIKLKDIKNVNGINTNWNIIKGFLDTNLPTEQNAKYHSDELGNLDDKFDNFMLGLQRNFYNNNLNPGQRLFLEQFSINLLKAYRANPNAFGAPNAPLNLNIPDNLGAGLLLPTGNQSILQSYLWGYSKRSVFDPNYYLKVLDEILINNGQSAVYGDVNKINRYLRYAYINIAKAQATVKRNNAFNDLMNSSTTEDILTDLFITALGERNNDFLDARPALRAEVEKYFKANNRSQYSHDGINWTLNQFQDNNVFPVNENLYKSKNNPLFQDASNQNRALKFDFKQQAITEGITNFGNVVAELLKDNVNPEFEGSLIRQIFNVNGLNVNSSIFNDWLGFGFHFVPNNGNSIEINFEGNFGTLLWNQGNSILTYMNNLEEYYTTYYCDCNCQSSELGYNSNLVSTMEPKWGQLANKGEILAEINSIPNLNSLTFEQQISALESHFNKNLSYTRNSNGVLSISNPLDDVDKYVYTEIAGWLDFLHIFKLFRWANSKGPLAALLAGETGEIYQGLNGNYSSFSYEDLPSNNVGVALYIRFGNKLKDGTISWSEAVGKALDEMKWVQPESAPNFDYIPHIINDKYPKNFTYKPLLGDALKNSHKNEFCKRNTTEQNNIREAQKKFPR